MPGGEAEPPNLAMGGFASPNFIPLFPKRARDERGVPPQPVPDCSPNGRLVNWAMMQNHFLDGHRELHCAPSEGDYLHSVICHGSRAIVAQTGAICMLRTDHYWS